MSNKTHYTGTLGTSCTKYDHAKATIDAFGRHSENWKITLVQKYFQACTGNLQPNVTKEPWLFKIFSFFYSSCIFITIGFMIAIKKKRQTENDINQHGPKNLDNFALNSVLISLAIYSLFFLGYLRG